MKTIQRHLISTLVFIVSTMAMQAVETPRTAEAVYEDYHQFVLREFPESATFNGDHRFDTLWTEYSVKAQQRRRLRFQGFLDEMKSLKTDVLTEEQRLTKHLFENAVRDWIRSIDYHDYLMPINQLGGVHLDLQLLPSQSRLTSDEDQRAYLIRLRAFPSQVDGVITLMREGMSKKIVLPKVIVKRCIDQLNGIAETPIEKSPLYLIPMKQGTEENSMDLAVSAGTVVVADALTNIEALPSAFEKDLKQACASVQDSYRKLLKFIQKEYMQEARDSIGCSVLPDGRARYVAALRSHVTRDVTPEEVFETGMREVQRLRTSMDRLKKKLGFSGTLEEYHRKLRESPEYYFQTAPELLARFEELLTDAKQRIQPLFERLPAADCRIKELEGFRAVSAPQAYYNTPPDDQSLPGYFYVNTSNLPARPKYTMTALTLHEAVPGHHLQLALAQELRNQPWFRRQLGLTAFVEGWALYAERLGYEMGMYGDPLQEYGALGFEMWRACRLVVDAGMHAKGWTRERAVAFMRSNTVNSEADIENEIDRYIADPGQACAYKIGQLAILEMRSEAERELGSTFRLADFHEAVLRNGAVPLDELRKNVRAYIRQYQQRK